MSTELDTAIIREQPRGETAPQPRALVTGGSKHRKVIEPRSGWQTIDFRELWRYRELLFFLTWRDVKVRYKQTVLGAAWAVIQPVMTMIVFSIFFGRLGGMSQHVEEAYPIFVYSALLPWTFFAGAVTMSGQSLVTSANLVSKVYFPRLIIPVAAVGGGLIDFAISFVVMLCLMFAYGVPVTSGMLWVPLFVLGTILAAVGVGTLLSALVIAYRDFRYVITFLVQIWMFSSPVAYPLKVIPQQWQLLYAVNPMVGMISGFRSSILGQPYHWGCIAVSLLATMSLLAAGALYFRRVERRFADII